MVVFLQKSWAQTPVTYPVLDTLDKSSKIDLGRYKGNKLLLVNIDAADSSYDQYSALVALSARVSGCKIVVFPSENSPSNADQLFKMFHNEVRSGNLIIASPQAVNGAKANAVYKWLANQTANGQISLNCSKPFYKVLVGRQGSLEAVFGPKMKINDVSIYQAINQ